MHSSTCAKRTVEPAKPKGERAGENRGSLSCTQAANRVTPGAARAVAIGTIEAAYAAAARSCSRTALLYELRNGLVREDGRSHARVALDGGAARPRDTPPTPRAVSRPRGGTDCHQSARSSLMAPLDLVERIARGPHSRTDQDQILHVTCHS